MKFLLFISIFPQSILLLCIRNYFDWLGDHPYTNYRCHAYNHIMLIIVSDHAAVFQLFLCPFKFYDVGIDIYIDIHIHMYIDIYIIFLIVNIYVKIIYFSTLSQMLASVFLLYHQHFHNHHHHLYNCHNRSN